MIRQFVDAACVIQAVPCCAHRNCGHHTTSKLHQREYVQLRLRGNDLAAKGQYDKALESYREALQHAPAALAYKIHSNMSLLALTSGDVATALSEASRAMEEAPSDFTTVRILSHSPLAIDSAPVLWHEAGDTWACIATELLGGRSQVCSMGCWLCK